MRFMCPWVSRCRFVMGSEDVIHGFLSRPCASSRTSSRAATATSGSATETEGCIVSLRRVLRQGPLRYGREDLCRGRRDKFSDWLEEGGDEWKTMPPQPRRAAVREQGLHHLPLHRRHARAGSELERHVRHRPRIRDGKEYQGRRELHPRIDAASRRRRSSRVSSRSCRRFQGLLRSARSTR